MGDQYFSILLIVLVVSGCAATSMQSKTYHAAEDLAQQQWQSCSHYPSVELVEITAQGNLLVRDRHYSSPPVLYQRCIAGVAYQQVLSGQRNAKSLIRDAYFIDTEPDRDYLYKPSGHFPDVIRDFSAGQAVYFFFVMDAPNTATVSVSFDWKSPSGLIIRTGPRKIQSPRAAARKWTHERFIAADATRGLWSVRLYIDSFDAGEYYFTIH